MKYNCEIIKLAGGRRPYVSPAIKELNWEIERGFAQSREYDIPSDSAAPMSVEMTVQEEEDWWN